MKQILFLTALVVLFIMNTTTSSAKELVDNSKEIALTVTKDDTQHIGKEKDIEPDKTGTTRSIILQPVYAYLHNKVVSLDFADTFSMVSVVITNNATGETVHIETYSNPVVLDIDLNGEKAGDYSITIEADSLCLEGSFSL